MTPDKRIPEGRFKIRILIFPKKCECVIYVFGIFIGIIGGTPEIRIPEGVF